MKAIRVRAPASTANLGPGFDCAGLALSLYHEVTVRESAGSGVVVEAGGEGVDLLPRDRESPVYQAMEQMFQARGYTPGRLLVESHSDIPVARGLGSSAAATLAGLAAGAMLADDKVDEDQLLQMGLGSEGHADNVAPCLYGGYTLAMRVATGVQCLRMDVPAGIEAMVAVPDFSLPTSRARHALPATVPLADAADNLSRVGMLTAAMAMGRFELLREAMVDLLHEPYRASLVPGFDEVRAAALAAGALGAALSGAGPSVLALVRSGDRDPGEAMREAWTGHGVEARVLVLEVDAGGLLTERLNEGDIL